MDSVLGSRSITAAAMLEVKSMQIIEWNEENWDEASEKYVDRQCFYPMSERLIQRY